MIFFLRKSYVVDDDTCLMIEIIDKMQNAMKGKKKKNDDDLE